MALTTSLGTAWVCTDCIVLLANGDRPDEPTEHEPLSAFDAGTELTCGLVRDEHEDDCDPEDECSCEVRSFSWSSCDGCNSPLGGERHAVTMWGAS